MSSPSPGAPAAPDPSLYDFSRYDLVIDARSPREYADDHVPGAVNWPVVDNDEYAEVGTTHKADTHRAYVIGVAYSLARMARRIRTDVSELPRGARILVYCFRGGKRSKLWHDNLSTIGFKTDKLPGGWKGYRRHVLAELERLPATLDLRVLAGPTGCGKTRLLDALRQVGEQVLDLEGIAQHRGSIIGALPGVSQPTQKYFDSLLLRELQAFDPSRPVWLEAESKKVGNVQIPESLHRAMHASPVYRIDAPMAERVRLWREDYRHFEEDPQALLERLQHLLPLVGREELERWQALAAERRMPELFERLMVAHYDPAYQRTLKRNYGPRPPEQALHLTDLSPAALREVARELARSVPAAPADPARDEPPTAAA